MECVWQCYLKCLLIRWNLKGNMFAWLSTFQRFFRWKARLACKDTCLPGWVPVSPSKPLSRQLRTNTVRLNCEYGSWQTCKDDEDILIIGRVLYTKKGALTSHIKRGPLTSHLILPFCTSASSPPLPHKSFTIKIQFSTMRRGPVHWHSLML